jgi:hypothetical protein
MTHEDIVNNNAILKRNEDVVNNKEILITTLYKGLRSNWLYSKQVIRTILSNVRQKKSGHIKNHLYNLVSNLVFVVGTPTWNKQRLLRYPSPKPNPDWSKLVILTCYTGLEISPPWPEGGRTQCFEGG